jgi:putative pyrroloquinoline-quinone binding quinoprotein
MSRRRPRLVLHTALAACTVFAAVLAGGTDAGAATAGAPWLQPDYNAAGSRANTAESTLTTGNVGAVTKRRTLTSTQPDCYDDAGDPHASLAAVVFSESHVYVTDGDTVASYVARTGALAWRTTISGYLDTRYTSLVVSHGLVIAAGNECHTNDPGGEVAAFHTSDGKAAWTVRPVYYDQIYDVAVSGKYLVLNTGEGESGALETAVYRVQDGSQVWFESNPVTYCRNEPYVVDGQVFTDACKDDGTPGELRAHALGSGKVTWRHAGSLQVLRGDSDTSAGHHLYATQNGTVLDLNPKSGAIRFTLAGAASVLAVDGSRVYATCGSSVCAYAVATGAKQWQTADAAVTALVADGVLYLGDGVVLAAASGKKIATLPAAPTLVGNGRLGVLSPASLTLYGLAGS